MSAPSENHYRRRIDAIADDMTSRYFRVVRPHPNEVRLIATDVVDAQIEAAKDLELARVDSFREDRE